MTHFDNVNLYKDLQEISITMLGPINLLLAIWQTVVAIFCIVITIIAGIQYNKKKTKVALHLFIAFIIVSIAAIAQCTPTILSYFEYTVSSGIPWVDNYIIAPWTSFQDAYYFLSVAIYFFYLFSMDLIFEEGTRKGARIIPAIFIPIVVVYGMFLKDLLPLVPGSVIAMIAGIDIWIGVYIIVLMIPLIIDSSRVMRKLEAEDPMRKRFISIIIFASSLLVMIISFVAETILDNPPNIFSFIAWVFAVSGLFFAYTGLYMKRS